MRAQRLENRRKPILVPDTSYARQNVWHESVNYPLAHSLVQFMRLPDLSDRALVLSINVAKDSDHPNEPAGLKLRAVKGVIR